MRVSTTIVSASATQLAMLGELLTYLFQEGAANGLDPDQPVKIAFEDNSKGVEDVIIYFSDSEAIAYSVWRDPDQSHTCGKCGYYSQEDTSYCSACDDVHCGVNGCDCGRYNRGVN